MIIGNLQLPEDVKMVVGLTPTVGAAGILSTGYINCGKYQRGWAWIKYNQAGDGTAETFFITRATALAGTNPLAVTQLCPIWTNLVTATVDLWVRQADAVNISLGVTQVAKAAIIEVDFDAFGQTAAGLQYSYCMCGSVGNIAAGNYLSIDWLLQPRYASRVINSASALT